MPRTSNVVSMRDEPGSEVDLRALGALLKRRRRAIIVPTVLAFLAVAVFVNVVTPRYTAESQILLENQETFFTRPDRTSTASEQASQVDPEAVGSQIQLMTSRDLSRRAIKDLGLQGNAEFDPSARGRGLLNSLLVMFGLAHDPAQDPADARLLQAFQDKLTVFSPPKTRVISIQFQSKDPELAARAANKIAELYIAEQSSAKRSGAKGAADALSGQIADLRIKLAKADAEREQYRAQNGLLAGSNNMTISGQQLADINSDLSKARAVQADAQAKASMIRDLIRSGKTADVTEVVNNDLVRRVSEQRVTAQSQLALESRTLMSGHPRVKELTAQVAELDVALKGAAKQAMGTLENEAKIAGQRVANLETVLGQQKKVASTANGDEVRLRSLDRIAQSYKDQLDSSMTKYQEAIARETSTATPADARIIARAVGPQEPTFPKKLPFIAFGTVAALVFSAGFIVAGALLSGSSEALEDEPAAAPVAKRGLSIPPRRKVEEAPVDRAKADRGTMMKSSLRQVAFPEPEPEPDLVFEPVAWPAPRNAMPKMTAARRDQEPRWNWREMVDRLRAFGQSAAESRRDPVAPEPRMAAQNQPEDDRPDDGHRAEHDRSQSDFGGVGWDSGHPSKASLEARRFSAPPEVEPSFAAEPNLEDEHEAFDLESLAARVVAAHVPGRGLHLVGASLGSSSTETGELLDLGRALSERGRSIIVDLNATPDMLVPLSGMQGDESKSVFALAGLSDLLAGSASFAEVIHRDHASRLHFIPTGQDEADFRDFDLILDALSETYDFIVLLAPAFPKSEIAKVMAPYADFVVLTAPRGANGNMLTALEAELIEAGAREVLVMGRPAKAAALRTPHVA